MTTSFSKAQYVSGEHEDCPESLLQIIMEEVDEIVYVSDIATYEILYLNEFGKKVFGLTDIGKGRKCYEVLQGIDAPCPFCTNQFLNCETFYTWELTNPISHRHYLLRDKLIRWNGRLARLDSPSTLRKRKISAKLCSASLILRVPCWNASAS